MHNFRGIQQSGGGGVGGKCLFTFQASAILSHYTFFSFFVPIKFKRLKKNIKTNVKYSKILLPVKTNSIKICVSIFFEKNSALVAEICVKITSYNRRQNLVQISSKLLHLFEKDS